MKRNFGMLSVLLLGLVATAHGQASAPLKLLQTIPLPNVKGRFDHIALDVERKRLFVAAVEAGSVEVVDLAAGKWTRKLTGFQTPTEPVFAADLDKLFVVSRDDGMVRAFRRDSLEPIDSQGGYGARSGNFVLGARA